MKKWIQVILTIAGVIVFFIICGLIGLSAEQSGRVFAWIAIPLIAYLLGLDFVKWVEKKTKEKKRLAEANKNEL